MRRAPRFTIRLALLAALVLVLAPLLAVGAVAGLSVRAAWRDVDRRQAMSVAEIEATLALQLTVARVVEPVTRHLLRGEPLDPAAFAAALAEARGRLASRTALSESDDGPQARMLLALVRSQLTAIEENGRAYLEGYAAGGRQRDNQRVHELIALTRSIAANLVELEQIDLAEIRQETVQGRAVLARVTGTAAYQGVLASVAVTLLAAAILGRRLGRPVEAIAAASRRMAEGDLSQRVPLAGAREHQAAATAFNAMAEQLERSTRKLRDGNRALTALHGVASALAGSFELAEGLSRALHVLEDTVDAHASAVHLVDDASGELVLRVSLHLSPRDLAALKPLADRTASFGDPALITAEGDGCLAGRVAWAQGQRRAALMPIRVRDGVAGTFTVFSRRSETFSSRELTLLATVASQFGVAVENARLHEETRTQWSRLEQIFGSTSDGIMLVDAEGRVLLANDRASELLGPSMSELSGRPLAALVDTLGETLKEPRRLEGAFATLVAAPECGAEGDVELRTPARRFLHWTARPTRDETGRVGGFTLTWQDVTQDREMSQLKSDFVSFATHQLRTPLAGIKWSLELVAQDERIAEGSRTLVEDARQATDRLAGLVNDLLDASRLEHGRLTVTLEPTDLAAITREALDEMNGLTAGHHVAVEGDLPRVTADPKLLREAVQNLLSNAIKYTPQEGSITVRMAAEGGMARWQVIDTGIGIPAAAQAKLFQKFYRADNVVAVETEGTGLGLYVVKLIVERLGGRIWFDSEEGRGTTFSFTVPLAPAGG